MGDKKKCKVWGDHKFRPIGYHYDWPNEYYYTPHSTAVKLTRTITILKCTKCGVMYHGELSEYKEQNSGVVTLSASDSLSSVP